METMQLTTKVDQEMALTASRAGSNAATSPADVLKVDNHHRKVSTWLSDELQSINESILNLNSLILHDSEHKLPLKRFVYGIEEKLGQARSKIAKSLLGVAAQQSGVKYSPLVADLEDLKHTLAILRENLEELLDSFPKVTSKSLSLLAKVQFVQGVGKANARAHVLASAKTVQERVQVADRSLDLLLASMNITAALERAHLVEVRKLQADLQILAVVEAPTRSS
jgi:hypothetical protein